MRTIYTPSNITKEQEDELMRNGLIIFDTCGLLDFYYLTKDYQKIMCDILTNLKDRIWIPAQVKYEFDNNYANARMKPIQEKYNDKNIQKNQIVNDLKTYIELWEKQYYHPYISDEALQATNNLLKDLEPSITKIKTIIAKEYQARKKEIQEIQNNDVIKKCIDTLEIGVPFGFNELKIIVSEGLLRYKNLIPPGYKDAESKNGIRQYGDLIIWKEIIRKAKETNKDVVFISNDQKADWRIIDETQNDPKAEKPNANEIGKPRRELLNEFEEETGQQIWFYTTAEFINKLEELYRPNQQQIEFYGKLEVVLNVMEQRDRERNLRIHHSNNNLLIRCDKCGELFSINADDINFEWEGGQVDDRDMGPENEYVSEETCTCPNCSNQIELSFHVWEYPLGTFNYQNIEINGGDIEKLINLSTYISFNGYETCYRCGEYAVLNESGLCNVCQEEFERFVNSDD